MIGGLFFSRTFSKTEKCYCTLDKELLTLHRAIRHFHHLLDERPFKTRTDPLPLVHAFVASKDAWSPRVRLQLTEISEYMCTMEYIIGIDNSIADTFSRNVASIIHLGIDCSRISRAQKENEELNRMQEKDSNLKWTEFKFGESTIVCDVSTGRPRPYIPTSLRKEIFEISHNISHPLIKSTSQMIASKYVWENMWTNIKKWTKECGKCQTFKISKHTDGGIQPYDTPLTRLADLHLAIVGPLPPSEGYKYLLTVIDHATRWTAEACAKPLIQ